MQHLHNEGKLAPLMSKTIFKRLLERVTNGSVFSFNNKLYKQTNGCGMGNPLSPVLANIFMCKLEEHIIPNTAQPFTIGTSTTVCQSGRRILLTISFSLSMPITQHHFHRRRKSHSLPRHSVPLVQRPLIFHLHLRQALKAPRTLEICRNTLWGALHQTKRLTTNWEQDLQSIKKRFQRAGYPFNFIQKTIHEFENPKEPDTIIPVNWFDDRRIVTIRVPYCKANEHATELRVHQKS